MGKINILSEELCNRIAAGEVIDRPYSAVKELIENSIDAGATEIEIYIERGGKDLIKVVDNGCGIEKEDMRMALIPHATSKISKLEDIDHIHTLGFRGEALATIACIAKVEVLSSVDGNEAYKVESDGDYVGKVSPAAGCPKGTQISVRNLFFNTPVRFKFMKTDKKEETDITSFVIRYILGNPDIAFRYYIDGKLHVQSYGGGLEEAITQVYGSNILPNCFKISAERNNIKISGFISNQNFFKANKTYQSMYLNGRNIDNSVISGAITNAYSAYAMKRQYPFYVLFFEMDDGFVDVNVHPNKSDVRFVDNQTVYGTVYKVISTILDGTVKAAEFVVSDDKPKEGAAPAVYAADYTYTKEVFDKDFEGVAGIEKYTKTKPQVEKVQPEQSAPDYSAYENYESPMLQEIPDPPFHAYDFYRSPSDTKSSDINVKSGEMDLRSKSRLIDIQLQRKAEQQQFLFKMSKYRGQLFNTYLMYEMENDVYIIDQHAAHERLIYDSLMKKISERKVNKQNMLVPYIFAVNAEEKDFIEQNLDTICRIGFQIEPFGVDSYKVDVIPTDLGDMNFKEFFDDLLSQVGELKDIKLEEVLKDKIAQTACKHAVKGGDKLTEQERSSLFEIIQGNMGLKCPHGRPVCVKIAKSEIEKMFKRKV